MLRLSVSSSLLVCLALLPPAPVLAAAMPPAPMPEPLPSVRIEGAARIDERTLTVRCREVGIDAYGCDVEVRLRVTPTEERVRLWRVGGATWLVRSVEGEERDDELVELLPPPPVMREPTIDPVTGEPSIDASAEEPSLERVPLPVEVVLRFARTLSIATVDHESFWILSPLRARHLVLGDGHDVRREGENAYGDLVVGDAIALEGDVAVDVQVPAAIAVNFGGRPVDGVSRVSAAHDGLLLTVRVEPEGEPFPIQHGGPVLGVGARFDLADEENTLVTLRGAYELAVADHFIGSVSFETDFESIYESLVIETASPELLVLLPSVAAGIGVVARQLGDRDADAALRLRLGMNLLAVGLTCDFDYWPAIGDWTASMVARLSI